MSHVSVPSCFVSRCSPLIPYTLSAAETGTQSAKIALNFNDVEISVFVRFISELTGKNFVLDDTIKKQGGKISVFSPTKVTPDQAYSMFVSALEVARLAVVPKGSVYQIVKWEISRRNAVYMSTSSNTPTPRTW